MAEENKLAVQVMQDGVLRSIIDYASERNSALANGEARVFRQYKNKTEIGKAIFKELYARFNRDASRGDVGFFLDDSKTVGLLSQCHSLRALMLLASSFGIHFDDKHILGSEEQNLSIREIMDIVMDDILDRIEVKGSNKYVFDASPYETAHFNEEISNIEAITWVITCFLQILKYHATLPMPEKCRRQERLVSAVSYGIRYINESFISGEKSLGTSQKLEIGWNFTKGCEEPSLYYTFTVCECLVEIFKTFEAYLSCLKEIRNFKKYSDLNIGWDDLDKLDISRFEGVARYPELRKVKEAYDDAMRKYEQANREKDPGFKTDINGELRQNAKYDSYNELRLRYMEINNGLGGIEGDYGQLETYCKAVAKEIWRLSQDKLADAFYYNDLHTTLTEDDISMATTSDALFNSVYMINIMLDAGLDEDMDIERSFAKDEDKIEELTREYNDLLESCQLANQKALRTYEKLKNIGKEYIVDQFLIGFNEQFTRHKALIKELRKRRMRVFSLLPLLIRTNNAISEYLIRYPQQNMTKYLRYILENRYEKDKKANWIWEKDGFFSCSNFYFISALGEFYSYYETYESEYIENYNKNRKQREAIIDEYQKELELPEGTIGILSREARERNDEIARLQEENAKLAADLANVSKPVEDAIEAMIIKKMDEIFLPQFCEMLHAASVNSFDAAIRKEEPSAETTKIQQAMLQFFLSLFDKKVVALVGTKNDTPATLEVKAKQMQENISKDASLVAGNYINLIKNSEGHESALFKK